MLKHLQSVSLATQKENTQLILIWGGVSVQKTQVPAHSETSTSTLMTLQQDLPQIMQILGAKATQNQPIPELSDTFTKFVCSPSKGKHPG